jgi:hypothetical protein
LIQVKHEPLDPGWVQPLNTVNAVSEPAALGEEGASSRRHRFRLLEDIYSIKKPRTMPGLKFAGDQGDQ